MTTQFEIGALKVGIGLKVMIFVNSMNATM